MDWWLLVEKIKCNIFQSLSKHFFFSLRDVAVHLTELSERHTQAFTEPAQVVTWEAVYTHRQKTTQIIPTKLTRGQFVWWAAISYPVIWLGLIWWLSWIWRGTCKEARILVRAVSMICSQQWSLENRWELDQFLVHTAEWILSILREINVSASISSSNFLPHSVDAIQILECIVGVQTYLFSSFFPLFPQHFLFSSFLFLIQNIIIFLFLLFFAVHFPLFFLI